MTVTLTVGTNSRQYSTWASAISLGIPTNISSTGSNSPYVLAGYADSEFSTTTSGYLYDLTGITTDATNTITLTAAAGQSFMDNASANSTALAYNPSNGVALKIVAGYSVLGESINVPNVIVTRLQMSCTSTGGAGYGLECDNNTYYGYCLLEYSNSTGAAAIHPGSLSSLTECVVIVKSAGSRALSAAYDTFSVYNCTLVALSSASNTAFGVAGSSQTWHIKNTFVGGFGTNFGGTGTYTGQNNASDQAISFGSSNQASLTYANQFQSVGASYDFRLKSGNSLATAGFVDTADVPGATGTTNVTSAVDIVGNALPTSGTWPIGAFQGAAAGAQFASTPTVAVTISDALTTAIQMATTPTASASISAALTTVIRMASAPNVAISIVDQLTTAINMATAPSASVSIVAALTTSITAASTPTVNVTVSDSLSTAIQMASAISAAASISATLQGTSAQLASALSGNTTISVALTTAIQCSAQSTVAANIADGLSTFIQMATASNVTASINASLNGTAAQLAAALTASAIASAQLTTAIQCKASPVAQATAVVALTTSIIMAAQISAQMTIASGLTAGTAFVNGVIEVWDVPAQ